MLVLTYILCLFFLLHKVNKLMERNLHSSLHWEQTKTTNIFCFQLCNSIKRCFFSRKYMMEERNCYKIKFHVVVRKIKSRKRNPSSAKRSRFYVKHENELFRLRCNNFSHKFISKYFTQLSVLISENLV